MARPAGSQNKDKPFRDALRIELAALGEDDPKALRGIARNLIAIAAASDGLPAIKEIADRLDGKVAQSLDIDQRTMHEVGATVSDLMKAIDGRTRSK